MANITVLEGAVLSQAVYGNENVDFIEPEGYIIATDENKNPITYNNPNINLQLALYQNSATGNYVIAVRGTEPTAYGDWDTNIRMFVNTLADMLPSAFIQALQFIEPLMETYGLNSSNTSIVGHSMGGSIAQYLGSVKGFETLTYNAYGVGDMNMVPDGSHENITNYITMHDFVSPLPGSKMVGTTYMLQDEDLTDVFGHGITNFTSIDSWVRGYSLVDDPRSIDVIDGIGSSGLDSAYELALRLSEGREFAMINGSMDDVIFGGDINNTLISGGGNDILIGGKGFDTLLGGADFDTYIVGNGDTIMDSDGKGIVYFQEEHLSGGTIKAGASCDTTEFYYGDGGVYSYDKLSKQLTFTKNGTNETLSIENFTNTDLGITLSGAPACPTTTGDCPKPINPIFNFNFSLPTPSRPITYGTGGGGSTYSGGGGGGGGSYTPHTSTPAPTPVIECVNSPVYHSTGTGGGGSSTGPIVLDLNRDGITSISIAASQALFDYDSDGVKENTAWIQSSDALLVNDKNSDGIINDATELFGNYSKNSDNSIAKSGYQALSYYDSNSDNVIDATDTRFNELSLWIDSNQDGVTDTGELNTLSEMGVTSITLNSTTPYIPSSENTNTIIQETTFTDASGEGIMRDVLFRYENTSKPTDGVYFDMDANSIKEKMTRWTDPNQWMIVKDINNDGQITSGKEVIGNHMTLPNGTKAADTIQALKTFDTNHDGKVDITDNSGLAFWIDRNHNGVTDIGELEALGAAGAIQTIKLNPYQTLLSGYDNNKDGVINGNDALSNYLYIQTNADNSVTLYLPDNAQAKEMIAGYTGGESIQTSQGEKIIKTILFYEGYEMTLNDTLEGTDESETLEGSSRSETLRGKGGRDILDAGAGDDVIEGGTGIDTYIADNGDMIFDEDGKGTVTFEGLTLTGGKEVAGQSGVYQGSNGETYTLTSDSNLIVKTSSGSETTIYDYNKDKNNLNIVLDDNPQAPTEDIIVSVTNAYLSESGNEMIFTVSLNTELNKEISHMESYTDANGDVTQVKVVDVTAETLKVSLSTQDGNAVAGVDYESVGDVVLTFTAGEPIVQTFSVAILDDSIKEINHTFFLIGLLNFIDMPFENISTCQNVLVANDNLHVDMKEVA